MRQQPATPEQPVAFLDWRANTHNLAYGGPCTLCGTVAHLRSHAGEIVHKTCAEAWNAQHPGASRFVSDTQPRRRTSDDDHA